MIMSKQHLLASTIVNDECNDKQCPGNYLLCPFKMGCYINPETQFRPFGEEWYPKLQEKNPPNPPLKAVSGYSRDSLSAGAVHTIVPLGHPLWS